MIKVKIIESINNIPCSRGKLILVLDKSKDKKDSRLSGYSDGRLTRNIPNFGTGNYYIPIIISETENIFKDDKYIDFSTGSSRILLIASEDFKNNIQHKCFKILALPEHFSEELLRDISNGRLRDCDKVYLQTYQDDIGNDSFYFIYLSNNNHIILVNIDSREVTNLKSLMSKYTKEELEQITKFWEDYHKKNPEVYKALENDIDYSEENSWENILQEYMKENPSFSAPYPKFEDWLIEYYHPPIRK